MLFNLRNKSFKYILYKILTVILCVFWSALLLLNFAQCTAKSYIYPLKFKQMVFELSDKYGLERALIFSIIKVESGFDGKATSPAGAIGLMQITPNTAKYIAKLQGIEEYDLTSPNTNIAFGCFYVKYLIVKFDDLNTALVAYNAGEGNVALWLNNPKYSSDKKTLKYIPFKESREYVEKINETFIKYKKLYGNILINSSKSTN